MGFFNRLFSTEYRRALAAEAEGKFLEAVRLYAQCGEDKKVGEMHLALAHVASEVDDRIRSLRNALRYLTAADAEHSTALRLLGTALRERGHTLQLSTQDGRRDLKEAGAVLEAGSYWTLAGDCYLELGDRNKAAAMYAKAGLVEKVEGVLGEQQRVQELQRREEALYQDYQLMLQAGQRDQAAEALRGCIEATDDKGGYRRLLSELEQSLLLEGRVTLGLAGRQLTLVGRFPLLIGRDADCDLVVRGPSVSRRHARINLLPETGCSLQDAGSRNKTLLYGLPLGATVPLPQSGTFDLGDSCTIQFDLRRYSPVLLQLEVMQGIDQGKLVYASSAPFHLHELCEDAPQIVITFSKGRPMARAIEDELLLNSARISEAAQLIRGDRLELGMKELNVF